MNTLTYIEKLNMTYPLILSAIVVFVLLVVYLYLQSKWRKRLIFITEGTRLLLIAVALLTAIFGVRSMVAEDHLQNEHARLRASRTQLKEGADFERKYICNYKSPSQKSKRTPANLDDVLAKMRVTCKILVNFHAKLLTEDLHELKAEWDELLIPDGCPLCSQSKDRINMELNLAHEKQLEIEKLQRVVVKDDLKKRLLALMPWVLSLILSLSFFKLTAEYFWKNKFVE